MTFPLRKDEPTPEKLTTADLAKANRTTETSRTETSKADRPTETSPELTENRPKPVRSEVAAIDSRSSTATGDRPATQATQKRSAPTPAETTPLFPDDQLKDMRARWDDIQTGFVDEPRAAVERADGLVAHAMQQLAEAFARERANLEHQWDKGDNVSTEDLRVAFQRYRSFFRRLLSM
jgi:hypothetical protein